MMIKNKKKKRYILKIRERHIIAMTGYLNPLCRTKYMGREEVTNKLLE